MSFNLGAWLTDFVTSFQPRTLAYGATAAALAIVLQAGILAGVFVKEGGVGFTTASLTENAKGAFVAVRFNPQASAADITKFLADNKATIVGGPAAGGLFKLRVSDSALSEDRAQRGCEEDGGEPGDWLRGEGKLSACG